jgi:predicted nucleic acid-binding protein
MGLVFDSSATVACFAPDERLPRRLPKLLATEDLIVPAIWPEEVLNALLMMVRRGRISASEAMARIQDLGALGTTIDEPDYGRTARVVYPLAERYGLTVYDAAYLELAMRRDAPLATLDEALIRAARQAKVRLIR